MGTFDRIQYLLMAQDRTQKELTDYLGIEKSVYSTWKNGKSKSYNKYLTEISEFFHTTPAFLMGWTDDPIDYENSDEVKNAPLDIIEHFGGDAKKIYNAVKAVDADNEGTSSVRTIAPPVAEKQGDVQNGWSTILESYKSSFDVPFLKNTYTEMPGSSDVMKKYYDSTKDDEHIFYHYFGSPGIGKTKIDSTSRDFAKIYTAYCKLNDIGKRKAVERIEELAEIERYKK